MPVPATWGPIIMTTAGDEYIQTAQILAFIWEGATSSGDTVVVKCRKTNAILWAGRTDGSQTYIGINLGPSGMASPYGFKLDSISSGRVLIYLKEAV